MGNDGSGRDRGSVSSGVAAMALVLAAALGWWLFSGNGPQGPRGNDARYAVPDVSPKATDGGDPAAEPSGRAEPAPGTLRIDSYVMRDELRLVLNYNSPASCVGAPGTPRVVENDVSVTVTLTFETDGGAPACSDELVPRTELVLLDSPLDGRALLDGSVAPQVLVEQTTTSYE